MLDPLVIAEWLREHSAVDFKLAGIANDGEVFIETNDAEYFYSDAGAAQEAALSETLRRKFSSITKVTFVVKPSLQQLNEVLEGLNSLIGNEAPKAPNNNLLDIEKF